MAFDLGGFAFADLDHDGEQEMGDTAVSWVVSACA